jgi:hypothetical protein
VEVEGRLLLHVHTAYPQQDVNAINNSTAAPFHPAHARLTLPIEHAVASNCFAQNAKH